MKAQVKVNISIHFEDGTFSVDPKLNEEIKYPLALSHAGVIEVKDKAEAERVIAMLSNHVRTTFRQMSVAEVVYGSHKPDLALAMGGDQEPTPPIDKKLEEL